MNVYIACGLTHVPRAHFGEYAEFIHGLALALKADGCTQVKYALVNSDPQLATKPVVERPRLCYLWDRKMVENADVLIAESSFPSTGLGVEMQIAESQGIPIIVCFRDFDVNRAAAVEYENPDHTHHGLQIGEGFVSLMALGIPSVLRVVKYEEKADGISGVCDVVRAIRGTIDTEVV